MISISSLAGKTPAVFDSHTSLTLFGKLPTLISFASRLAVGVVLLLSACPPIAVQAQNNPNYALAFTIGGSVNDPKGITTDAAGNVYVADTKNHRVVKYDRNNYFLGKIGSQGSTPGKFSNPSSVTVDNATGNLYVADTGNNRIQQFDTNGAFIRVIGSVGSGTSQFSQPYGVAFSNGFLYVTDSGNNRVSKFTASGSPLGSFGSAGSGNGQFNNPTGIAADSAGKIYVSDTNFASRNTNGRVEKFDSNGNFVWATSQTTADLATPLGLSVDGTGKVYVASVGYMQILIFNASTGAYLNGFSAGNFGVNTPYGVSVDNRGNIYSTVYDDRYVISLVVRYDASGNIVSLLNGNANSVNGDFNSLNSIAVNRNGNIYVTDTNANNVKAFNAFGGYLGSFGENTGGSYTRGVAVDTAGNVFVTKWDARYQPNVVDKYDSQGNFLVEYGGDGSGNGKFNYPYGLSLDNSFNIFVADVFNNRVQKLDITGAYVAKFGTLGIGNGQFQQPNGVAVDSATGNFYVADTGNNRIQKLTGSGGFVWKTGALGAANSEFDAPTSIAVKSGKLYVADSNNNRVEVFDANGSYLTQFTADIWGDQYSSRIQSVTLDNNGLVYLTDTTNQRVVVLKPTSGSAAPTIAALSPTSVTAGSAAFTLTVTGANFVNGSQIRWNGSSSGLTTAFGSATALTTVIPASSVANAGTFSITVANPDGTISNAMSITVTPIVPIAGSKLDIVRNPAPVLVRNGNTVSVTCGIQNVGGAAANNVRITGARLKTAPATNAPQTIGAINAGSSANVTLTFPASQVPASGRMFLYIDYTSANSGSGTFSVAVQ